MTGSGLVGIRLLRCFKCDKAIAFTFSRSLVLVDGATLCVYCLMECATE